MGKQTIGIGTVANDGTGDQIRDAFDKINDNFIEVYNGTYFTTSLGVACSDQTSNLTIGEKIAFDMPFDFVVTRVYAEVKTAPTGSALTIDVEDEGTSILNAVVSISASANNAETSTFASSASSYAFTKGDLVSIDIDQIGSTIAGAGLIVFLEGYRT